MLEQPMVQNIDNFEAQKQQNMNIQSSMSKVPNFNITDILKEGYAPFPFTSQIMTGNINLEALQHKNSLEIFQNYCEIQNKEYSLRLFMFFDVLHRY